MKAASFELTDGTVITGGGGGGSVNLSAYSTTAEVDAKDDAHSTADRAYTNTQIAAIPDATARTKRISTI